MQTIHKAGLYEGVVRRKTLLKKSHLKASLELFKKHTENCKGGKKKRGRVPLVRQDQDGFFFFGVTFGGNPTLLTEKPLPQ